LCLWYSVSATDKITAFIAIYSLHGVYGNAHKMQFKIGIPGQSARG
jgi:hypothetical protein